MTYCIKTSFIVQYYKFASIYLIFWRIYKQIHTQSNQLFCCKDYEEYEDRACCKALTADCLACTIGVSVDEYCVRNPDTAGCSGNKIHFEDCFLLCYIFINLASFKIKPNNDFKQLNKTCRYCLQKRRISMYWIGYVHWFIETL